MSFTETSMPDKTTMRRIQKDLDRFVELGIVFNKNSEHTDLWNKRYAQHRKRLIDEKHQIDFANLRNFCKSKIFLGDNPSTVHHKWTLKHIFLGDFRGERQLLKMCLDILERKGFDRLLKKYPCPTIGNPSIFSYKGYKFTHRWFRHIYLLGLMNEKLASRLDHDFISLDIGCHCGLFSSLVHQEYPGSKQVLVDLPETLLLARYFLSSSFPEAKIAGVSEILQKKEITRDFLEKYDFILLPSQFYKNLDPGSVDLITSFACLGELKRSFFDYYVQAPVFQKAKYFFTANPVDSSLWFKDSDLSILDYPIWEKSKKLHFSISPVFIHPYSRPKRRLLFSYTFRPFHTFFEHIGTL